MNEIPLTEIASKVYQFSCLNADETTIALQQAQQISDWPAAPIRQGSEFDELREEYRAAKEIKCSQVAPALDELQAKIHRTAARVSTQLCGDALECSELRLVRYDEGGFFKTHSDTQAGDRRHFAIVTYLNDEFEGGATIFPLLSCKVQPQAGQALVFEAHRLHRADTIKNGTKYVAVMWLLAPQPNEI